MTTFSIEVRYIDERDYRTVVVGVPDLPTLRRHVADYAGLEGIQDIRISETTSYIEYQVFTL